MTWETVTEIRRRHADLPRDRNGDAKRGSVQALALEFGISARYVCELIRGKAWVRGSQVEEERT